MVNALLKTTRLHETPYGTVDLDGKHLVVRVVRSERPYATTSDIYAEGLAIQHELDGLGRMPLLVDLRAVTPRNDQGFEVAIADFRRRVFGGRHRAALLVRTAVGALQVKRHMREDGFPVEVFTSEEEALEYLSMRPRDRSPHARHDATRTRSYA